MNRYYSIATTLIIVGLLLFLVQSIWCIPNTFWYSVTGNLGSAVLVGGLFTLFEYIFQHKENEKRIADLFKVSMAIKNSGLRNILTNSQDYHYHELIIRSKQFSAIMNDGRRWVGNHMDAIESRFNTKGTITEFFFVDPSGVFCKALENKTRVEIEPDLDPPGVKISQTISLLRSTWQKSNKSGRLLIYYLKNYPTQTLFYTEDTVIVTPYQTSSGRAIIPLYEYSYNPSEQSIGSHLYEDLENVRKESKCEFDSDQKAP